MKRHIVLLFCFVQIFQLSFSSDNKSGDKFSIPFVQYKLSNGLEVILHQDKSDPIVAVAIQYHVGSNRETPGRTGFAHLFEHMMFQQSENVGKDQYFKKIQGAGGTLNGGTGNDGTVYYEVMPRNALEMVLWMESDRMGFFRNSVTQKEFVNQQSVVLNEKRQTMDNQPYGFNSWVIAKSLYPARHPYSWTVIGEMEDIRNATVADVKAFHEQYYVPNNSTLVIAGDFELNEVKKLVEKYFGEIPAGNKVTNLKPEPVTLQQTKKFYHEDSYAKVPQFTMVWPVTQQFAPDSYPLSFLARLLGDGNKSPFYRILVKERKLASSVEVNNYAMELAGQFTISIKANPGVGLDDIEKAVFDAFSLFEKEGISGVDLERILALKETEYFNSISSVLGKSYKLAYYNEYAGSASFIAKDIENHQLVKAGDIQKVYQKYIRNRHYVATSFVPKGQTQLAASGSVRAEINEDNSGNEVTKKDIPEEKIAKTPSKFDRSIEPGLGSDPELRHPAIWKNELSNGIQILGIARNEVPLVQYSVVIEGGHLCEPLEKAGTAALLAGMLKEGTQNRSVEEFEEAVSLLGARINVNAGTENITIQVNTLARNFEKTWALVEEMLLSPRWDRDNFELLKMRMINDAKRNASNPSYTGALAFYRVIYGETSIFSVPPTGTVSSLQNVSLDDVKSFYSQYFSPKVCRVLVAGNIDKDRVMNTVKSLAVKWEPKEVKFPEIAIPQKNGNGAIYLVDIPGARQSVIYAGYPAISRSHEDYFPANVMNYKLGGSFSGNLNMVLREEKGYSYGARSGFAGFKFHGNFTASTSVRSDATCESVNIIRTEIEKYVSNVSSEDVQFAKNAFLKSRSRDYETLGALINMLNEISGYNLPQDYIKREEAFLKGYCVEQHQQLARKYLDLTGMIFLVAGDAKLLLEPLAQLGLGSPVMIKL